MRPRFSHLILLATFVTGGVIAPVLHRVQHRDDRKSRTVSAGALVLLYDEGGCVVLGATTPTSAYQEPLCILCKFAPDELVSDHVRFATLRVSGVAIESRNVSASVDMLLVRGRSPPLA